MAFETTGLREALAEHEELAQRHRDVRPFFEQAASEVEGMIDEAWAARRSPGGDAWPPLKRSSSSTGSLERAHLVSAQDDGFSIDVPLERASFQFFGTRRAPGRNPLPIEPGANGGLVWMQRGGARRWWSQMLERLEAYLTGGDRGR